MNEAPVHDTNEMMRRRNQQVTDQLLEELDAGRFDSALTERIVATPSAFPRLLRACYRALAQQLATALANWRGLGQLRRSRWADAKARLLSYLPAALR